MSKAELTFEISQKTGIEKGIFLKTIESLMQNVKTNMAQNKNIAIIIPEHFIPTFKPSKEFVANIKAKRPS